MNTVLGGLFSIAILTFTLGYAIKKSIDIFEGTNPNITQNRVPNYYSSSNNFKVADTNFRIAVGGQIKGRKTL